MHVNSIVSEQYGSSTALCDAGGSGKVETAQRHGDVAYWFQSMTKDEPVQDDEITKDTIHKDVVIDSVECIRNVQRLH